MPRKRKPVLFIGGACALAALVALGLWLGVLVARSINSVGGQRTDVSPQEELQLTRRSILRFYLECQAQGAKSSSDPGMGRFQVKVGALGPRAVPILISILDEPGVLDLVVFDTVLQIDGEWKTDCFLDLVLAPQLTAKQRAVASGRVGPKAYRRLAVALKNIAQQEHDDQGRRSRAARLLPEVLTWVVETPEKMSDEERLWAREQLRDLEMSGGTTHKGR